MTEKGRLTGYHVLFMLLGFFGIMVAVNIAFTVFAVKTFPGEQVEKSYVQGINYNQTLASREYQAAQGITSEIGLTSLSDGRVELLSTWEDGEANPLTQLQVTAVLSRPASDDGQIRLDLKGIAPGQYTGEIADLAPGAWQVLITATTIDDKTLSAQKSVLWAR